MTAKRIVIVLAAAAAAACATAGGGKSASGVDVNVIQADHKMIDGNMIPQSVLGDDVAISYFRNANDHFRRGQEADRAGNPDQARGDYADAAAGYASFADKLSTHDWALRMRYESALDYNQARRFDDAAAQAFQVYNHKDATPVSKALSAKLMASSLLGSANAALKAGKLPALKFVQAEQRGGKPPEPHVPAPEWKRFIDAVDLYLAVASADPEAGVAEADRRSTPGAYYAQLAGEIQFASDNMQDAQRRFDGVMKTWPNEADFVAKAVPLYLQTFLVLGDTEGHDAAVDRLRTEVTALAEKAPAEKKPTYQKILADLETANAAKQFGIAQKLLDSGKYAEAAVAFEAIAAAPRGSDAANALHNGAIAWDRAGNKEKSTAIRQRIVKEYPDSKLAPLAQFQLALRATEEKRYDESVKLYNEYLARWPSDKNRCAALQNIAYTLDTAKKKADAAAAFVAFGTDGECSRGDPNTVARYLYLGGQRYEQSKQPAKAKEAWAKAVQVQGVTDEVVKSEIAEAKRKLGK